MADCSQMKKGDIYVCKVCGLELMVTKPCSCVIGAEDGCNVPLRCCGKDMVKKKIDHISPAVPREQEKFPGTLPLAPGNIPHQTHSDTSCAGNSYDAE